MSAKERLDKLLLQRGLVDSRARAQSLILAGRVYSGERRLDKPGIELASDAPLTVRGQDHPYVSRGGLKLAHGLDHFGIAVADCVGLDIGASTGGFTDVLLRRGARRVYAVDVGHGQLAWPLRQDGRVVVLERVNARHLTAAHVPDAPDIIVCDASFISLRLVLPPALGLAAPGAAVIALVKPQFEAGKDQVGKRGVVRDPAVHAQVCAELQDWLAAQPGWRVIGVAESPILGPEGNREFLLCGRHA